MLLKQAEKIFDDMCHDGVLRHQFAKNYFEVVDSEQFAGIIQKSKALVTYTDCFVLKDPSDKMSEIWNKDRQVQDCEDPYHALCYVTGILDTIVSTLPKKTLPEHLKSVKQRSAITVAFYTSGELNDYVRCVLPDLGPRKIPPRDEVVLGYNRYKPRNPNR